MANLLDRFNKKVIGSYDRISDVTPIVLSSGDFQRVNNINVIITNWNNILLIPLRSYIDDPEFGSELYKYVFEPKDEDTLEGVKNEIEYRLLRFEDRAELVNLEVQFLPGNEKGFNISISVKYEGETADLTVTIDESLYEGVTR